MNPPLRAEADREALIEGLRDGTIDCIATDHAPHARDEKEVPFEEAPMGTTGLETAFAAVYTELVLPGVLPLALVSPDDGRRRARSTSRADDRRARRPTSCWSTSRPSGRSASPATRAAPRTAPSTAAACGARSCHGRRGRARLPERLRGGGVSRVLERDRTALVVIDMQEAFRPAGRVRHGRPPSACSSRARGSSACRSSSPSSTRRAWGRRARGGRAPRRVERRQDRLLRLARRRLRPRGPRTGAGVRIEAHVCVAQTVQDLLDRGIEVHVAADAVGRAPRDPGSGLRRWSAPAPG